MDTMWNDDRKQEREERHWEDCAPAKTTRWLVLLGLLLFAAAAIGGGYIYEQTMATSDLTLQNHSLQSTIDQMRNQIETLTTKLDQMAVPPPAQPPAPNAPATKRTATSSTAAQDRRMRQVQSQLSEQQKQLKETQDQIASAKSELEGQLGSTRDELTGSVAKTHDELMDLEKRGERSFYEFDLSRSKMFQREGPIQISLRKADARHQSYDLMMLVDDHELAKKKVDLYEPVWLHQADQPEPVQVVVNKIDKDHVHGYVSAPKYRESELASNAAQPSGGSNSNPVSTPSPNSSSYSSSTPSSSPATSSQGQPSPSE